MKKLLLILFFLPLMSLSQDKVKFLASGLTCSMCSKAVHKSLSTDKTIKKIEPNLETQVWYLEYEKDKFDVRALNKKIEDAGFSLSKVWLNDKLIFEYKKTKQKNGN